MTQPDHGGLTVDAEVKRGSFTLKVKVVATDAAGNRSTATKTVTVRR